jgi:hypothetical protein
MNKENAKQFLPLVQALADSKTIQYRVEGSTEWCDESNPSFCMPVECYRVKHEPRRVWIGCLDDPHSFVYKKDPKNSFAVEFVEVIK